MNKSPRRNILIALAGGVGLCLVVIVGLVIWLSLPDSPADVARHATQTADAAQAGVAQAAANATATAEFAQIDSRLQAAQPVFSDTLGANSRFVTQNAGQASVSVQGGATQIDLPFNAAVVWPTGQNLGDFVAELDCLPMGSGAFCGVAYGDQPAPGGRDHYYASFYGAGGQCGFEDDTGGATSTHATACTPPASPAGGGLNRLRVERFGANLRFWVNGQLMDQRVLSSAANLSGGVGLYFGKASSDNSGVFYVSVANFGVAKLP